MRKVVLELLASASVLIGAVPAHAQTEGQDQAAVQVDPAEASDDVITSGDIVVTARRKNETLQNVPQTVTAITSAAVQEYNIRRGDEITAVVPGLSLSGGSEGTQTSASIRGVSVDAFSGASPTLDFYLNETPINADTLFSVLYDLGQIEVLRGPQGTNRGRTAPSGAITVSTRRADLDSVGGYVSALGSSRGGINGQGAINIPLITDRLALRIAGIVDRDRGNQVRSVFRAPNSDRLTTSGRVSLAFEPVDAVSLNVAYQRNHEDRTSYISVEGTGALGGPGLPPAGYNGPVVDASDRRSLQGAPSVLTRNADLLTGTATVRLPLHTLTYVGGYQETSTDSQQNLDIGNLIVDGDSFQFLKGTSKQETHEVRLASDQWNPYIDYVVGFYAASSSGTSDVQQVASFLPGAFGNPAISPVIPGNFNPRYQLPVLVDGDNKGSEFSIFGTLTGHIGEKIELSVGGRLIRNKTDNVLSVFLGSGTTAVALPVPCALAGFGSTYPGYCDINIAARPTPTSVQRNKQRNTPAVYNASLSYRPNANLTLYATVGSSWRQGPAVGGIANATNDPVLTALQFLNPERSTSYEAGAKTSLFGGRARVNIAVFRQDFDGFIYRGRETPYLGNNGALQQVQTTAFTSNADARVTGFDLDTSFRPTQNWNIGVTVSYADGKLKDAPIPCRDANFDGVPDAGTPTVADFVAAGTPVALCNSSLPTSRDAKWSATGQTEYFITTGGGSEAYLRGLLSYKPRNPNQDLNFTVGAYALLNLYAGLRSPDNRWDVGLFAKNLTDTGRKLTRNFAPAEPLGGSLAILGNPGYYQTSYTLPREIGVTVRFAFGSR
ncbi:TonB-dependent receptor [Sphingomonas sp.]|uniref:TonB-dependent receptor n=1 Tax=Sphingomonas sp. TaxID=28214 RepID=UPI0035C87464